ncbi:MAG: putative manganese transporter [Rhodospirillales bacterium]
MLKSLLLPRLRAIPLPSRGIGQRGLLIAALALVVSTVPNGWRIAFDAMSEAYLAVAVFVAGTLMLVLWAERALKTDLGLWLERNRRWQVPAATLLGAFPGCGGAIIAVTQFTRGYLSFGSVVATLTATMGDAMFLLMARDPQTALLVLGISMPVAVVTGYAVDLVHGPGFLRRKPANTRPRPNRASTAEESDARRPGEVLWLMLIVPGLVIGILGAFQIDVDAPFLELTGFAPAHWLGVAGAVLGLVMWIGKDDGSSGFAGEEAAYSGARPTLLQSAMANTNFVMAWVIFAFVGYDLAVTATGLDLATFFAVWGPVVPAVAILVGFVPGCGPQIMVTTLYLAGSLPFSAQLGNAIANDGDALFPAIAVAPKAALVATIYSAVPAALVAYGWYLTVERGI